MNTLSDVRVEQVEEQKEEMMAYLREREEDSLNQIESELQTLKQRSNERESRSSRHQISGKGVSCFY